VRELPPAFRAIQDDLSRYALALSLAIAVAGCSGGDDRLSSAEFTEQANAVCAEFQRKFDRLPEPRDLREYRRYMTRVIPLARGEIEDLAGLKPPEEDEPTFMRLLANSRETLRTAERLRAAVVDAGQAEIELLFEHAERLGAVGDRLAGELGLTSCIDQA
jgi:hypothetical protein